MRDRYRPLAPSFYFVDEFPAAAPSASAFLADARSAFDVEAVRTQVAWSHENPGLPSVAGPAFGPITG